MVCWLEVILHYGEETGVDYSEEEYRIVVRENRKRERRLLEGRFSKEPMSLSVEELEFLLGGKKNVKLDYSGEGYFTVKNSSDAKELDIVTKGVLYELGNYMTLDGRLVYGNNKPVRTLEGVRMLVGVSRSNWDRKVNVDIRKYSLIRREVIGGDSYYIMNPLFVVKDRNINETVFIAFHRELKGYLMEYEYYYLCKKFGIIPD